MTLQACTKTSSSIDAGAICAELDKAISPLALPILAGGGTLSAAMELSTRGMAGVVAVVFLKDQFDEKAHQVCRIVVCRSTQSVGLQCSGR